MDSFLLDDLVYDESLMRAHASSQVSCHGVFFFENGEFQVFKYADSNQLFFTCQIRLCQKQMGMCQDVTVSGVFFRDFIYSLHCPRDEPGHMQCIYSLRNARIETRGSKEQNESRHIAKARGYPFPSFLCRAFISETMESSQKFTV